MTAMQLSQRSFNVDSRLLLSLYAIVPTCILIAIVDYAFLDFALRDEYFPKNPGHLLIWAVLFNFPHIVSSMVTLADDEYIPFYKDRFKKALIIIGISVLMVNIVLPMVLPRPLAVGMYFLFFAFFAAYTMYHVLSQQFGIGMMLMKVRPTRQYEAWRWLSTIAATLMYFMVFGGDQLKTMKLGENLTGFTVAQSLAMAALLLASLQGLYLTKGSQRKLGTVYVSSNIAMLIIAFCFLELGYGIFVIALPRFVHDVTAFIIYSTHDQNRNREKQHNYIYRFLSFLPIPPIILCPILAILLANSIECGAYLTDVLLGFDARGAGECIIQRYYYLEDPVHDLPQSMQLWMQIMFICGFFHYYIEGFVWKREAIHRHSVSFV